MNDVNIVKPNMETLHALGFENMREYKIYMELKKSLRQQKVPVGIAS